MAIGKAAFVCAFTAFLLVPADAMPATRTGQEVSAERSGRHSKHPVKLAEVASHVDTNKVELENLTGLLRTDIEAELLAIDWSKARARRSYLISAAVTRLDTVREGEALKSSCTVSATLRDAGRGTILAVVEGRSQEQDRGVSAASTERGALATAVRATMTALPEAIRRSK